VGWWLREQAPSAEGTLLIIITIIKLYHTTKKPISHKPAGRVCVSVKANVTSLMTSASTMLPPSNCQHPKFCWHYYYYYYFIITIITGTINFIMPLCLLKQEIWSSTHRVTYIMQTTYHNVVLPPIFSFLSLQNRWRVCGVFPSFSSFPFFFECIGDINYLRH